mmetsp:Transcript_90949/g.266306  ORF Transcript_90949/g.266306 Transcript_90949/m.266306 type:complete len:333 (-) Transcript_90949:85-1083(-)
MLRWWRAKVRGVVEHAGHSVVVVWEVLDGMRSFAVSLLHVAQAQEALAECLRYTPPALAAVGLTALFLWTAALPLDWAGLLDYDWRDAVKGSSFLTMWWLRMLLPEVSSRVFFAVLRARDEKLANSIKETRSVDSKKARFKSFLMTVLAIGAAVALLVTIAVTIAPLLLPMLAAAIGTFIAAWWMVLIIAVPIIGIALVLGIRAYSCLAPFLYFWQFDPVLFLLTVACIALGVMKLASPRAILRNAVVLYYSCSVLTQELLVHYTKRLERTDRERFLRRHCWRVLGFGLPICGLVHYLPLAAVASLEVFHGAAASLVVDLLALESGNAGHRE